MTKLVCPTGMQLLAEKRRRATPRGRDVRKMEKPWVTREVVFTCSNGWTIEILRDAEDFALEGFFMGHCLGSKDGPRGDTHAKYGYMSLREPDGTPHATITCGDSNLPMVTGRCDKAPREAYLSLVQEWKPRARGQRNGWGNDDDSELEYHEQGHLNDVDYRDLMPAYRDVSWHKKRGVESA